MRALVKPGRLAVVLTAGLLLCWCAESAASPKTDDGTLPASQAAPVTPAANLPPSGAADGSTVPRFDTPEDAIRAASVASPYRISEHAAMGKIRYRIAMRDGVPWPWPETGEQHVEHEGDTVVLTVCRTCGKEAPPTAAELQGDLQPNHWVDNSDGDIRMLASDMRGATVDRRMHELVLAVQLQMNGPIQFGKYLTSREAFEARRGDCSELALLLAAGAKARHIPVRVVAGMAYASRYLGQKRVFGPHMWVQAWNGTRWSSYDAGLGEFDSTHLALTVGDGSPEMLAAAFAMLNDVRIVSAQGVLPALASGH
jgi:hypothetical protein